jgi:hypothetical protein
MGLGRSSQLTTFLTFAGCVNITASDPTDRITGSSSWDDDRSACEDALAAPGGVLIPSEDHVAVLPAIASGARPLVAWTGPREGTSDGAPFVAALDCRDGWSSRGPVQVNPSSQSNEGSPRVAWGDEGALVVWHRADGVSNQILISTLDDDGQIRGTPERTLETSIRGLAIAGSVWQPDLTPLPSGGYALVGLYADPEWTSFLTFLVILNEEGVPASAALPLYPRPGDLSGQALEEAAAISHDAPVIAAGPDGHLWVAWDARSDNADRVQVVGLSPDGSGGYTSTGPTFVIPSSTQPVAGPSLAIVEHASGARAWLSVAEFGSPGDAIAIDVTDPSAPGPAQVLAPGQYAFRTRLVQVSTGEVLAAWQARNDPTHARGVLRTRWLTTENDTLRPSSDIEEAEMRGRTTHLVYPLAVGARGEHAVVAWTAGAADLGWRTSLRTYEP